VVASWSAAVDKTIDPTSGDFKDFQTAITWLNAQAPLTQSVLFKVTPATYNGAVTVSPVNGMSSTVTVAFKGIGGTAVIDAGGAANGLTLNGACTYYTFENIQVQNVTGIALNVAGPSSTRATFCTFTNCKFDAPAGTSSSVRAAYLNYPWDMTFTNCVFSGGGWSFYTQQINRCVFEGCEFDGKDTSAYLIAPFNSNDANNTWQNCFFHGCGPTGHGLYFNWSQYGNNFFHNTIIMKTSNEAVFMGSCCAWTRAQAWRNNIIVNLGTGPATIYGFNGSVLDYNDMDHNCYYAPNATAGAIKLEQAHSSFSQGTLAQWKAFLLANPSVIPSGGGTTFDQNSIEGDPGLVSMVSPYDIHLQGGSACLDSGTTTYVAGSWITGLPANYKVLTDFEGDPRPATNVDIGADEVAVSLTGSGTGKPGTTITFNLMAPPDAGLPYQMASSFGSGPIPIDTRKLDLSPDPLFFLSALNTLPTIFQNYAGLLSKSGTASAKLNIPAIPQLTGTRIYTAFITVKATAPSGVSNISNSFLFTIQ